MPDAHLKVFRGSPGEEGRFDEFDVPVEEGMVVLDALHWIQGHEAPDLAVRWNCKAAKCGSCSAEVDGRPSLTCKTRLSDFDLDEPITVEPMRAFPLIRDLVTDVSWNYEVNKTIQPFTPPTDVAAGGLALAAGGHRAGPGIPQVHRVLPVPGRLPRPAQPRDREAVHGPALPRPGGRPRDAPDRPGGPARVPQGQRRDRLLQHHQVLHRGLPGAHQDHRQRDHPAQGARRRRVLRPDPVGLAQAPRRAAPGRAGAASSCRSCRATPPPDGADRATALAGARLRRAGDARRRRDAARLRRSGPTARRAATRARPRRAPRSIDLARPDARDPRAVARRLDLRLPRRPDQQRRRVHGRRPGARAGRELGAREVHLLLDSKLIVEQLDRSLAGQGREADPALGRGAADARRASSAGRRRTCRARRTRSPTRWPTRRSTGRRRAARHRWCGDRAPETGHGGTVARRSPSGDRENPIARTALAIALVAWLVAACGGSSTSASPVAVTPPCCPADARRHELGRRLGRRPAVGPGEHPVHRVHGGSGEGHRRLQLVQRRLHVRPDDGVAHVRRADDDAHGLHRSGG